MILIINDFDLIKFKYNNITKTKEDDNIIYYYKYESEDGTKSPYTILNKNLVSNDRKNGVRNILKYLYIFLKALRKFPRYYPEKKILYRWLTCLVNISQHNNNKNIVPYIIGNKKTFWGFTSTSPYPNVIYFWKTVKKRKTIFSLSG